MNANVATFLEQRLREQQREGGEYDHWHLQRNDDGVLWLLFDKKGTGTNTLDAEVLEELGRILDNPGEKPPRAIVLRSLKRGGFCAGADIEQFSKYSEEEMAELLQQGHDILDRLEKLKQPTIAVVHGHCLGGGLELALACDRRIGLKDSLEMGFPEIQLGLHPGLGGTFRLTGLIDPVVAMTMMLTGKPAHDKQTLSRGLVDALVEERHLENAVAAAVEGRIPRQRQSLKDRLMTTGPARRLAARKMRAESEKQAPSRHYPAPCQLIDLWCEHGGDRRAMQRAEIKSFAALLDSETSRNLVRVFFLREGLKLAAKGDSDIGHVHVIGAGAMGGDIAAWCALQGYRVTLTDVDPEPIAKAVASVTDLCRDKHKSAIETRDTLDRLTPDPAGQGAAAADLIIEAVPENAELKKKIYQGVEPLMKKDAILASNTSSIPLEQLASFVEKPERLLGIHFFNPVSKMLIVEVVSHDKVDASVQERAVAFTNAIGKLPVPVHSYPGFLVNRALMPYLMESLVLLDEGVDKTRIDRVAVDFGMPMGPVELADQVGLDICLHVADVLKDLLDKPMADVPGWLRDKVEKGELGAKSGQGFYKWESGKAQKDSDGDAGQDTSSDEELTDRLLLPMLDACVECYRKDVVDELDHIDAALIFGTGFAPFRGGPMQYARTRGITDIVSTLESLREKHGERFAPDEGWKALQD
ncbi:MAG: 3-hydroxyacyl-CoA dehydrogenase NAD-binding domain-containing protein [Halioglobus sp.]|nr:3-hydroxyacyl-CoA dehydrogenase NAD-binding domain-containing protein [Halioglobus sp.]